MPWPYLPAEHRRSRTPESAPAGHLASDGPGSSRLSSRILSFQEEELCIGPMGVFSRGAGQTGKSRILTPPRPARAAARHLTRGLERAATQNVYAAPGARMTRREK